MRISTHDLTRRSTLVFKCSQLTNWFQLTTSQGGRLWRSWVITWLLYFNSRPHKEVDAITKYLYSPEYLFQLTTSQGGRPKELANIDALTIFQLTTSQGGRPANRIELLPCDSFQLTTSQGGRQQFLHKKFSFQNHFLCSLHIIHSYYINIAFFSTLFLQNLHFFWCESPRIFLFTCLSHSAFWSLFILILLIIEPLSTNFKNLRHCPYLLQNHLLELIA